MDTGLAFSIAFHLCNRTEYTLYLACGLHNHSSSPLRKQQKPEKDTLFVTGMNWLAKYRPTDECLITDYLQPKVMGKPLPLGQIDECDLYSQEPWKIFNTTLELKQTFYVFTKLTKMGSRNSRTVGSGTWKGQHPTKIFNHGGELLGYKKSFKFQEGGGPSATSGRWIMKEFSLCNEGQCDYVLCKIEYVRDKKSKDKEIVPVQFDRQAKRARLLHNSGDRTSICDFAVALPSVTVDGVQPATAQAYAEQLQMSMGAAPALHLDNDDLAFAGFSGDAIADSLAPMAMATMQGSSDARSVAPGPTIGDLTSLAFGSNTTLSGFWCNQDTGGTTYPAFDNGPYADLLPPTVEDYTNNLFEVDADYLVGSNPFANPLEDDTTAMLASTLGTLDNQTNTLGTPDNQTYQQRSVAELQEQEVPVPLEWADQFFLG